MRCLLLRDSRDGRKFKLDPVMGRPRPREMRGADPSIMTLIRCPSRWRTEPCGLRCGCSGICRAADMVGSRRAGVLSFPSLNALAELSRSRKLLECVDLIGLASFGPWSDSALRRRLQSRPLLAHLYQRQELTPSTRCSLRSRAEVYHVGHGRCRAPKGLKVLSYLKMAQPAKR